MTIHCQGDYYTPPYTSSPNEEAIHSAIEKLDTLDDMAIGYEDGNLIAISDDCQYEASAPVFLSDAYDLTWNGKEHGFSEAHEMVERFKELSWAAMKQRELQII